MILDYVGGRSVRVLLSRRQNQRQGSRRTVPNTAGFEDREMEPQPREFRQPAEARKGNRSSPRASRRNAAPPNTLTSAQ